VPFHLLALRAPEFQKGEIDTHIVEQLLGSRASVAAR
jgi:hypothetical protein